MVSSGGMEYGPVQPEEVQPLWSLLDQALNISLVPGWNDHVGPDKFRVIRRGGKLAGGMGIVPMGQWFGGSSVPTGAVTSVGIAPEFRVQAPPGGISWVIGSGKDDEEGTRVTPASLYYQQVEERLGKDALDKLVTEEQQNHLGEYRWVKERLKNEKALNSETVNQVLERKR